MKRIIEISENSCKLNIRYGQLVIASQNGIERSIPCEDIGILLIDNSAVLYTHSVFTELLNCRAAVVLCNGEHNPAGMLLPIDSNSVQTERQKQQTQASQPLKKRLWKQLIKAKITHQGKIISNYNPEVGIGIAELASKVKSGDPENIEARASRLFWKYFLGGRKFKRQRGGEPPNNLLNYGYMVLRAATARAICCAGLLPTLGIHHCSRYNSFCLADDIMEPFRGYIEEKVLNIWHENPNPAELQDLSQLHKARLLETLHSSIEMEGVSGPLMTGLHKTAASLTKCFDRSAKKLSLPEL
ncbi:CRISPR-associated endonuclease Cas1 [Sedimentisphaera cyanobacteriorum]|uniref:CRISPR-associated endonuclease Cas1 n=1 Tax=Sedimentisphaera cyanobacteriorum TaxID=1940790 RepID=A0A1Q2HLP4_9BACT|nr:type II CRISPR-associated endonuclease Cas1 [Sedimentisphaera cyanobacteriorum]AQQ08342.1 CRISPR-associated endonuclease Cas1 [Sedimentisphaera cyanobacteriorum]